MARHVVEELLSGTVSEDGATATFLLRASDGVERFLEMSTDQLNWLAETALRLTKETHEIQARGEK
jgi:hypothetical protein